MTEDITEEQEKTRAEAAGAVWDLGLPLVKEINTAESEAWLRVIELFVGFLGELIKRKRRELPGKEDK